MHGSDDRWTIRGVSPEIRAAVKAEVAQRGETVGEFVERVIREELDRLDHDDPKHKFNVASLADRLEAVENRLAAVN